MQPLAERRVGRTHLYVEATERSTLLGGRGRSNSGQDTVYTLKASANRSRNTKILGQFPTLETATWYLENYSQTYGLLKSA